MELACHGGGASLDVEADTVGGEGVVGIPNGANLVVPTNSSGDLHLALWSHLYPRREAYCSLLVSLLLPSTFLFF